MELVVGGVAFGKGGDVLIEIEHHPGIDLEGDMQVEGLAAGVLRVEVDLEGLAHAVGLDEVALIVDVKAVLDGVLLDGCDVAGDVQSCDENQLLCWSGVKAATS